jgi:threonylcarbamoyladenosine tRNA methylthiotransferase MtaB
MKKAAIQTLGCRVNQLESSIIHDRLVEQGWEVVNFNERADIYIINTCTVTEKSDVTSRYFIRKAKKTNPDAKIVVTGCYSQVAAEELAEMPEVDLVIGNAEKLDLVELITKEGFFAENTSRVSVSDIMKEKTFRDKAVLSASGRVRANIKIQDGCNHRCSYCIIPYARGRSRSSSLSDVIKHVKDTTERGYKEIVLTGIHLGQWGLDLQRQNRLVSLLRELEEVETIERYRLSSMNPNELTDELVNFLAGSTKFCRHLHISLQSADDLILERMNRNYTVRQYTEVINTLVEKIPFINIGSDIIVGFPGETEQRFQNTCRTLENLPVGYLHVFSYSERKGTPAVNLPGKVDEGVKKQRNAILNRLAKEKNLDFRKKLVGGEFKIVVENTRNRHTGRLKGMTDNFLSVQVEGGDELKNTLAAVRITSVDEENTFGVVV